MLVFKMNSSSCFFSPSLPHVALKSVCAILSVPFKSNLKVNGQRRIAKELPFMSKRTGPWSLGLFFCDEPHVVRCIDVTSKARSPETRRCDCFKTARGLLAGVPFVGLRCRRGLAGTYTLCSNPQTSIAPASVCSSERMCSVHSQRSVSQPGRGGFVCRSRPIFSPRTPSFRYHGR